MKMIEHNFEKIKENCYLCNPTISFQEKKNSINDGELFFITLDTIHTAGDDLEGCWNNIIDSLTNNKDLHYSTPTFHNAILSFPYDKNTYFVHYHYKIDRIVVKRPNSKTQLWEICIFE